MKRQMISLTLTMATGWFVLGGELLERQTWSMGRQAHASQQRVATQETKEASGLLLYSWGRKHLQERLQRSDSWLGRRAVALLDGEPLKKPRALKRVQRSKTRLLKLSLSPQTGKASSPRSKSLRPSLDLSTMVTPSDAYLPAFGYGMCLSFGSKSPQTGWCSQPASLVQRPLATVPHTTMMRWERLVTPLKLLW